MSYNRCRDEAVVLLMAANHETDPQRAEYFVASAQVWATLAVASAILEAR